METCFSSYLLHCLLWVGTQSKNEVIQSILNAAARLVFSARRSAHITPLLRDLLWLRVPERIRFRLCVLTYSYLSGTAPFYLADSNCRVADVEGCRHLRSSATTTSRPARQTIHFEQRGIPCRRFTGMEQSIISRSSRIVTDYLPTRTENIVCIVWALLTAKST